MVLAGVVESPVMASSTEVRARQTAEIVSREVGVEEYRLEHFLRERARDYFTGSHMEREVDALNRFRYGLDELLEQNDGSLIVVSHYHVLRMYLGKSLENGGVVHAQYRDGEVRVRGYLGRE